MQRRKKNKNKQKQKVYVENEGSDKGQKEKKHRLNGKRMIFLKKIGKIKERVNIVKKFRWQKWMSKDQKKDKKNTERQRLSFV